MLRHRGQAVAPAQPTRQCAETIRQFVAQCEHIADTQLSGITGGAAEPQPLTIRHISLGVAARWLVLGQRQRSRSGTTSARLWFAQLLFEASCSASFWPSPRSSSSSEIELNFLKHFAVSSQGEAIVRSRTFRARAENDAGRIV